MGTARWGELSVTLDKTGNRFFTKRFTQLRMLLRSLPHARLKSAEKIDYAETAADPQGARAGSLQAVLAWPWRAKHTIFSSLSDSPPLKPEWWPMVWLTMASFAVLQFQSGRRSMFSPDSSRRERKAGALDPLPTGVVSPGACASGGAHARGLRGQNAQFDHAIFP